jgi:hypothetical protein
MFVIVMVALGAVAAVEDVCDTSLFKAMYMPFENMAAMNMHYRFAARPDSLSPAWFDGECTSHARTPPSIGDDPDYGNIEKDNGAIRRGLPCYLLGHTQHQRPALHWARHFFHSQEIPDVIASSYERYTFDNFLVFAQHKFRGAHTLNE